MDDKQTIAIGHFSLSGNFLHLVTNVLSETISKGNQHVYVGKPRDDIEKYYSEQTKWSDFRVMIPTLFLFFHGIELLLKGANYKIALPSKMPSHNLANLFSEFKINYPSAAKLTMLLDKYIYPTQKGCLFLFKFYQSNGLDNSSNFFDLLKYPYSKKMDRYHEHSEIRFLGSQGIAQYEDLLKDIQLIREEAAKL
jgi:hypothetical protein